MKEFHDEVKAKHEKFKESQQPKKSKKNKIKSVFKADEEEEKEDPTQIKETKPDEPVIKEEPAPQAQAPPPQQQPYNPMGGIDPNNAAYRAQMEQLDGMNDDQLREYCNQLKNNKEMAKQHFNMQNGGNGVSDAQFDSMVDMLSPEMLRMSLNFAK